MRCLEDERKWWGREIWLVLGLGLGEVGLWSRGEDGGRFVKSFEAGWNVNWFRGSGFRVLIGNG